MVWDYFSFSQVPDHLVREPARGTHGTCAASTTAGVVGLFMVVFPLRRAILLLLSRGVKRRARVWPGSTVSRGGEVWSTDGLDPARIPFSRGLLGRALARHSPWPWDRGRLGSARFAWQTQEATLLRWASRRRELWRKAAHEAGRIRARRLPRPRRIRQSVRADRDVDPGTVRPTGDRPGRDRQSAPPTFPCGMLGFLRHREEKEDARSARPSTYPRSNRQTEGVRLTDLAFGDSTLRAQEKGSLQLWMGDQAEGE